jgi:hypothetical protein
MHLAGADISSTINFDESRTICNSSQVPFEWTALDSPYLEGGSHLICRLLLCVSGGEDVSDSQNSFRIYPD